MSAKQVEDVVDDYLTRQGYRTLSHYPFQSLAEAGLQALAQRRRPTKVIDMGLDLAVLFGIDVSRL